MEEEKTMRHYLAYCLDEFRKKRVAVYARVSVEGEMKHHSIEAQKENLREYVENHPNWEFTDYYVDEGVTGTKLDRPAFNRMMRDAEDHKIDIILTKTISRFGRNNAAVQKVIQKLRELDVTVIFDDENLSTADPDSMFYIQYLGIQAENYARQTSDYQCWAIRNRFKEGIPTYTRLYGYRMEDHKLIVIPEEAEVVKRIFSMYLSGMGNQAICKVLNEEGVPKFNHKKWIPRSIYEIIRNEKYTGDMLLQKRFVSNCLSKLCKRNHGELPQYLVEGSHEAIIDKDTFKKAQAEVERRKVRYGRKPNGNARGNRLFSQLLYCGHCGKALFYKEMSANKRKLWICPDYLETGARSCPVGSIRDDILERITKEVLIEAGLIRKGTELTNELLKTHIYQIIVNENRRLDFHMQDGEIITKTWAYESRSKSWTEAMREKARMRTRLQLAMKQREVTF